MTEAGISIQVRSSWDVVDGKSVQDATTLTPLSAAKRDEDGSLTDMVELESCVLLTQPVEENGNEDENRQSCTISFILESISPCLITNVVIISEARVIEVYGAVNEYLTTIQADLLDEVEDTAVYSADIALSQLTQECTLRFARLNRPSNMWLYGVKVLWKKNEDSSKITASGLNFGTLEQRLKDTQTLLSGRAENCKRFLTMYSKMSEQKQSLPDAFSLLSLLPTIKKTKSSQENVLVDTTSPSLLSDSETLTSNSTPANGQSTTESGSPLCVKCSCQFESTLDQRLMQMESRILNALDEKVAALQQHQDRHFQNLLHILSD